MVARPTRPEEGEEKLAEGFLYAMPAGDKL